MATQKPDPERDDTVTYQFVEHRDVWEEWRESVPRDTNLDDRIRELIRGDIDE